MSEQSRQAPRHQEASGSSVFLNPSFRKAAGWISGIAIAAGLGYGAFELKNNADRELLFERQGLVITGAHDLLEATVGGVTEDATSATGSPSVYVGDKYVFSTSKGKIEGDVTVDVDDGTITAGLRRSHNLASGNTSTWENVTQFDIPRGELDTYTKDGVITPEELKKITKQVGALNYLTMSQEEYTPASKIVDGTSHHSDYGTGTDGAIVRLGYLGPYGSETDLSNVPHNMRVLASDVAAFREQVNA